MPSETPRQTPTDAQGRRDDGKREDGGREDGGREALRRFLAGHPPYDMLAPAARQACAEAIEPLDLGPGEAIYRRGETVPGLFAIAAGSVEIAGQDGHVISRLGLGQSFGERGLLRDGYAPYDARALEPTRLYRLPADLFHRLMAEEDAFAAFFGHAAEPSATPVEGRPAPANLDMLTVGAIMSPGPVTVTPGTTAAEAARVMAGRGISCVLVVEEEARGGGLVGLLTTGDLTARVLGAGLSGETPVAEVMTREPFALGPEAVGLEAVALMLERHIGHLPVVDAPRPPRRPVGIVTRTDLLLRHALSSPLLIAKISAADDVAALGAVTAQIPAFLAQLVGAGAAPHVVCRLVTDITDALTRRLIALAEADLGPAPVPYLWAVCGSQGRQEQTGISDQDNCLILDDAATSGHDAYFAALAKRVSDGLDACGFVYCPGGMMATTARWRQPARVWRGYFEGWIRTPSPEAQMLASVMFDLRAVAGDAGLLERLQAETLARARANSIFVSHMVRNALTHQPPLGLFRGFALVRSGEHKDSLDLKHNGVVPVVDLARVYAIMGEIAPVNTRARLTAATAKGVISEAGGRDLIAAYDLIAAKRLAHQAERVRAGLRPDNFLVPAKLSDLDRSHLKDAFVVVKTMQASLAQGRHTLA